MSEKRRRLRDAIVRAFALDASEVERVLGSDGEEASGSDQIADSTVKRLMMDPPDFCCPLSHQLMQDPVVAADSFTYERSWVEECFKRQPNKSPMTGKDITNTVLHPNQHVKSSIVSFKEQTIKSILLAAPGIESDEAEKLIKRGEGFLRPWLPDTSAGKQLGALLLLRMKLPGNDRCKAGKEAVSLLAAAKETEALREAFAGMQEADVATLLSSFDEATVTTLHGALLPTDVPCRTMVSKDLAQKLASRLKQDRLEELWHVLQAQVDDPHDCWMQAAACLLCAHISSLQVGLQDLSSEVLAEVVKFVEDRDSATAFAKNFFKCDLEISAIKEWPIKGMATIFQELARRLPEDKLEEKLRFLVKGHQIDDSHQGIEEALTKELYGHMSRVEAGNGSDMEGLFLKLVIREVADIPQNIVPKLTFEPQHLGQVEPEQLMLLAQYLGGHDRSSDGARVAAFAAKAFASRGKMKESEDAFLKAFCLDRSNMEAADGVAQALSSAHKRCELLEGRCSSLEAVCKEVKLSCKELKAKADMAREIVPPIVWDLSTNDFSMKKGSQTFQLPGGIEASLNILPPCGFFNYSL